MSGAGSASSRKTEAAGRADAVEPFCSIIVPTYRRPAELAGCLGALAALDYPRERFEVVVVDDGGEAPLDAVVAGFRDRLDLTLLTEARGGPAAARNAGAAHARGELLAFTDDDCRPRPAWLRELVARHVGQPERALGGRTVNALPRNPYSTASELVLGVKYAQDNADPGEACFFASNNMAIPARGFHELGGFDASFRTSEDRDLCSRWIMDGRGMTYEPAAVVDHASDLTLRSFCRRHVAYGRGAFMYRKAQARRGGRAEPLAGFYASLAREALRRPPREALATVPLLVVWHLANSWGALAESLKGGSRRPRVDHVLHVTWSGRIGGIERLLAAVTVEAAKREGPTQRVVFLDGRGPIGDQLVAAGLASRLGARWGFSPRALCRLALILRRARPDVVHHHTHALGTHLVSVAALPRATRVYTEHFPQALGRGLKFRVLYALLRRTIASFVAPATAMAGAVEGYGVDPARIVVVPHPLTIARRARPDLAARPVGTIGVVARLERQKRIDGFIDTLADLRRRGVDCQALVVGDGSLRKSLMAQRDRFGLRPVLRFVGEQDDVAPWLDQLDVFLMTSESEPFGLAALEAMARGVPVVAMPCPGGLAELVREGGLLLGDRTAATAADAIEELLESAESRARLRLRGEALAERHSLERVLARLEDLYGSERIRALGADDCSAVRRLWQRARRSRFQSPAEHERQ